MDAIKEWFTAITGIVILSSIGDGILPSGNIKKFVRILFGVILIIAVCRPLTRGDFGDIKITTAEEGAYIDTENMDKEERERVLRLYKANLAKQIGDSLSGISQGCTIEVQLDVETQSMEYFGRIRSVTLTVHTKDSELYLNNEIEEIVSSDYGVPKKNIAIKYIQE